MDWQKEMDELRRREAFAEELGGAERVKRQHDGGRLTIRERIDAAGRRRQLPRARQDRRAAPPTTRNNDLDGARRRPTSSSGARRSTAGRWSSAATTSRCAAARPTPRSRASTSMCEQMAHELRLPLIRLVEGSGGGGSVKTIETTGRANVPGVAGWEQVVDNMGTVPRVALGLGSVAGLGAAHLAAAHYSVMVKDKSALFVAGPPVVERLGPEAHEERAGRLADPAQARAPSTTRSTPRRRPSRARGASCPTCRPRSTTCRRAARRPTIPQRREEWLCDAIPRDPRKVYKMRAIVEAVVDRGSFFEIGALYGRSVITGLARLDGWPVAMMASDPYSLRRRLDGRHLPEGRALRRHGADLPPAGRLSGGLPGLPHRARGRADGHHQAGRARDVGHLADDGAVVRGDHPQRRSAWRAPPTRTAAATASRYAWPSGRWGSLPLEGGIEAAYRADIDAAADPAGQARRDRGAPEQAPLAVPLGGDVLDRGDHRSARARGRSSASSPTWPRRCGGPARTPTR